MQRGGVRHLVLLERGIELPDFDVEACGRNDPPFVHRILRRVSEGDDLGGLWTAWHFQRSEKVQCGLRVAPRTHDLLAELSELPTGWRAREAADAGADRI